MTRDERITEIRGRTYTMAKFPAMQQYCRAFVGDWMSQCSRKPGHGLGGLFCWQHAKNNPEVE